MVGARTGGEKLSYVFQTFIRHPKHILNCDRGQMSRWGYIICYPYSFCFFDSVCPVYTSQVSAELVQEQLNGHSQIASPPWKLHRINSKIVQCYIGHPEQARIHTMLRVSILPYTVLLTSQPHFRPLHFTYNPFSVGSGSPSSEHKDDTY